MRFFPLRSLGNPTGTSPNASGLHLALLLILATCALSFPPAALAQEAPPFEEEGFAARPALRTQNTVKTGTTPPRPGTPVVKTPVPAKPQVKAPAQPVGKAKPVPHHGPAVKSDGKRYLRSLDEDHDGRITHTEYMARNAEQFGQLDANRDGRLSPAELGRTPKSFANMDANGDGRISRKEFLARREESFFELDQNHDGLLSRQEAKAAKLEILHRRAEKKAEKKAIATRKAEREALKAEKTAAKEERARKRLERAAEKEARAQRRLVKMTEKARSQWQVLLPPPDMTPAGTVQTGTAQTGTAQATPDARGARDALRAR